MARTKAITTIDAEISKIETELTKLQKRQDDLNEKLLLLQKQKQEYQTKQVMDAFRKSGKTMQELMNFLNV